MSELTERVSTRRVFLGVALTGLGASLVSGTVCAGVDYCRDNEGQPDDDSAADLLGSAWRGGAVFGALVTGFAAWSSGNTILDQEDEIYKASKNKADKPEPTA